MSALIALVLLPALSCPSPGGAAVPVAFTPAAARTCKQVESCEEALRLWCSGYRRADDDHDGIPCENVCRSLEQVEEIRRRIGC